MKTSKETKSCKWREEMHLTDKQGREGKRIVWCCKGRTGIFLKSWRCVGWYHALCPLSAQPLRAVDAAMPPSAEQNPRSNIVPAVEFDTQPRP